MSVGCIAGMGIFFGVSCRREEYGNAEEVLYFPADVLCGETSLRITLPSLRTALPI